MLRFTLLFACCFSSVSTTAMVGTNIGGWQVLEPWITPSLFYRFLGANHSTGAGMDSYTLCQSLGPKEGNFVMNAHWDAWVTEDHVAQLADRGVEIVRLPIGDWTLKPYGPYVGCMDGAEDKIQWFLDTCAKYGMKVLLDVHAVKDSQNGFDNSGQARDVVWVNEDNFSHWENQNASWLGTWNGTAYTDINYKSIEWAVNTVDGLLDRWGTHPALYALEPVNEPWGNSPLDALKNFYREVRALIQRKAPSIVFVFHDSFRFSGDVWNDLFNDTDNVVLDTHFYTAWNSHSDDIGEYCDTYGSGLAEAHNIKYDVWVGEWSLATDTCAMWLGGFNDRTAADDFECDWVDCPYSYLPEPYNLDFDRTAASLGPYGSNPQTVQYGKCATDSSYFGYDDVNTLGHCALAVFDEDVQGQFLWTFRNELEPKWSYVQAYDLGWIKP